MVHYSAKFAGTGVALVTPFDVTGQVDLQGLKKLLDHTASEGVDYYVVHGTTGESATTTPDEKNRILDFTKNNNPAQLPIVYGIGGNNTKQLLEVINQTDFQGIDAVLSVSPYYNKPSQEGIYQHYVTLADACPVPVMLYNVPGRTGSNIAAATTLRLADHPNILGIKEASGDMIQAMTIVQKKPDDFMLISGDDMLTVPLYAIGSSGVISVLANAYGGIFKAIHKAVLEHDFPSATRSALRLLNINPLIYEEGNPVGVKQVLHFMGVCENVVRSPLVQASESLKEKIFAAMEIALERGYHH